MPGPKSRLISQSNYTTVRFLISCNLFKISLSGLTENEAVPQDYLDKWIPVAESRITIGGYRLAYVLNYIFGTSTDEDAAALMIADLLATILQ